MIWKEQFLKLATRLRIDRPLRMFRWNRPIVNGFSNNEYLFQRLNEDIGYQEGVFNTTNVQLISERIKIRWAEQSVNRGKFGKPIDVLFPKWCNHGVFGYLTSCLPVNILSRETKFTYNVEHAPYWDNYSHSNIFVEKDDIRINRNSKIKNIIKKEFRESIASNEHTKIFREPTPGQQFAWLRRRLGL